MSAPRRADGARDRREPRHRPRRRPRLRRRRGDGLRARRRPGGARRRPEIGATGLRADITDPGAVAAALARVGALDVLVNNAGLERMTPVDDGSPETSRAVPAHHRDQRRRHLPRHARGAAAMARGRADHQHRLDLGPRRRAAVRRLCRLQARGHRADQDLGEGARAARHPGQRRGPGLGADGSLDALARRAWPSAAGQSERSVLADIVGGAGAAGGLMEPADIAGAYLFLASAARRQHHRPDARHRSRRGAVVKRLRRVRRHRRRERHRARRPARALRPSGFDGAGPRPRRPDADLTRRRRRSGDSVARRWRALARRHRRRWSTPPASMLEAPLADHAARRSRSACARSTCAGRSSSPRRRCRAMPPGGRIINIASELAYLGRAGRLRLCGDQGGDPVADPVLGARACAATSSSTPWRPGPTDTPLLGFDAMTPDQQALERATRSAGSAGPRRSPPPSSSSPRTAPSFITGQCISVDGGAAMH